MDAHQRIFEARKFFWDMMDRWDQVVDVETARRQIHKLAEALPPFTPIPKEAV